MTNSETAADTQAEANAAQTPTPERQAGDEADEAKRPFQPVRGWTKRVTGPVQYRKFTDANMRIIGFKFNLAPDEKPPQEVLDVMHAHVKNAEGIATGLKFQNTRTHGKVWTIPDDVEGRTLADRIDFQLSELAHKLEEDKGRSF